VLKELFEIPEFVVIPEIRIREVQHVLPLDGVVNILNELAVLHHI
jgi:hypothetical protein